MENNFLDLAKDKIILGRPMKNELNTLKLVLSIRTFLILIFILAVLVNSFAIMNFSLIEMLADLTDYAPFHYFLAYNLGLVLIVIFYGMFKSLLKKSLNKVKVIAVRILSFILFLINLTFASASVLVMYTIGSATWAFFDTAIKIADETNQQRPFSEYIDFNDDWNPDITFSGVANTVLIIAIAAIAIVITIYMIRIISFSLMSFLNTFSRVNEKYIDHDIIQMQTLENTSWNRDIVSKIIKNTYSSEKDEKIKATVKKLFSDGEVRSYKKFDSIVGVYLYKPDGSFGAIYVRNSNKNTEALDYLINDYAYLSLKNNETAQLIVQKNNEHFIRAAQKCHWRPIKENKTHYVLSIKQALPQTDSEE